MRNKIIVAAAALSLAVFIAILIGRISGQKRAGPWPLPDGTQLSFAGVTYGTKHAMRYGDRLIDRLYPILTPALRKKFNCKVAAFTTAGDGVVVWLWDKGNSAPPTGFPAGIRRAGYCLVAADEQGREGEPLFSPNTMTAVRGTDVLRGWELRHFPRRARETTIRIYDYGSSRQKGDFIGEVRIPNQSASGYPNWKPSPLPVTVKTNGLAVTLNSLTTGLKEFQPLLDSTGRVTNYLSRAELVFMENDKTKSSGWRMMSGTAISSTAEVCVQSAHGWGNGTATVWFPGTLWREEPAWRLRIKASRFTNFPPQELWMVRGLAVPAEGETKTLDLRTNINGSEIGIFEFSRPKPSHAFALPSESSPILHVRSPLPAVDSQLVVAAVTDNQGEAVRVQLTDSLATTGGRGATIRELDQSFLLDVPDGATSIDVSLAYTKLLSVEFLAKPAAAENDTVTNAVP